MSGIDRRAFLRTGSAVAAVVAIGTTSSAVEIAAKGDLLTPSCSI